MAGFSLHWYLLCLSTPKGRRQLGDLGSARASIFVSRRDIRQIRPKLSEGHSHHQGHAIRAWYLTLPLSGKQKGLGGNANAVGTSEVDMEEGMEEDMEEPQPPSKYRSGRPVAEQICC